MKSLLNGIVQDLRILGRLATYLWQRIIPKNKGTAWEPHYTSSLLRV